MLAAAALARPAAAQTCGNAVREPLEQCDDGNHRNLDGCDASCRFEQVHRINSLQLQDGTASGCPANAFGAALTPQALLGSQIVTETSVATGATSILLHFLGLDDLTGTDDAAVEVGIGSGAPVQPGSVPYDARPDWWYLADPALLDGQRQPLHRLAGSIAANRLRAGPGGAFLNLGLPNQFVSLWTSSLTIDLATGASSTPAASTGLPPGHLAVENLDPALQSFASAGVPTGNLCGNVSAHSLAQTLAPPAVQVGQLTACIQYYTAANSLLDVLVSGCDIPGLVLSLSAPTQPDASDPNAPPAGAGPPYTLLVNEATRKVSGCRDGSGALVDLSGCLQDAAYSVHFAFTSDRAIARNDHIYGDGFESGGIAP